MHCIPFVLPFKYHDLIIEVRHSCSRLTALRIPPAAAKQPDCSVVIVEGHTVFATQTYVAFKSPTKAQTSKYSGENFTFFEKYEHPNKVQGSVLSKLAH
jgi:hypothetical protein